MTTKKILLAIAIIMCALGCEKIIDLDYRSVESMYVINSYTNDTQSCVEITRTTDMDQPIDTTLLSASSVTITNNNSEVFTLTQQSDGIYISNEAIATAAGEQFTLNVTIDDNIFSSYSDVFTPPTIDSLKVITTEAMGMSVYSCSLWATKGVSESTDDSYFKYELYVEGAKIVWGVYMHGKNNTQPLIVSILFARNVNGKATTTDSSETVVNKGDKVEVFFTAIDKRAYDYLNTLSLASQSSSNPSDNFSGGALGYYNAYISNIASTEF